MHRRLRNRRLTRASALAGTLWLGFSPQPGAGDEVGRVRACIDGAARPLDCVGATVEACVARPGGDTTVGIVDCIAAETAAWDSLLNEAYRAAMTASRTADATGDVVDPALTREATLRDAQRAWIAFRDAECRSRYAAWGRGTMRQIAGANCVMEETAERAIELRVMRPPE